MVARVAPAILELLADGAPRSKAAIVAALAGRHAGDDAALTLVRLAVTGRVEEAGGRETPGDDGRPRPPDAREDGPQGPLRALLGASPAGGGARGPAAGGR